MIPQLEDAKARYRKSRTAWYEFPIYDGNSEDVLQMHTAMEDDLNDLIAIAQSANANISARALHLADRMSRESFAECTFAEEVEEFLRQIGSVSVSDAEHSDTPRRSAAQT